MSEPVYRCTRCDVKKQREEFPGVKKRNSWCRDCVKAQRAERKEQQLSTTTRREEKEDDGEDYVCACGGGIYTTWSDFVCVVCNRVYRAPKSRWIGRRVTEEEIDAARKNSK